MTYQVDILDSSNNHIGELMTASDSDILKLINKGLIVINKSNGQVIQESAVVDSIGVSDGIIET